jgi:type I restriction enzyme S subunit
MIEWKEYKIKDLGKVVTGKTPSSNFPDEFGIDIPFVTPTDYKNYNKWCFATDRSLSSLGLQKLKNNILP